MLLLCEGDIVGKGVVGERLGDSKEKRIEWVWKKKIKALKKKSCHASLQESV